MVIGLCLINPTYLAPPAAINSVERSHTKAKARGLMAKTKRRSAAKEK
jgi:hypothetical protein